MYKFIYLFFSIIYGSSVFGQQYLETFNRNYDEVKSEKFESLSMSCYNSKRDNKTKSGNVRSGSRYTLQYIKHDGKTYQVKVQKTLLNKFKIRLSLDSSILLSYTKEIEEFNYVEDMLDLKSHIQDEELGFLKTLRCFVGPSAYFHRYEEARDLAIVVHFQSMYFGDDQKLISWFNNYVELYPVFSKDILATKDTFSRSSSYEITKKGFSKEIARTSDILLASVPTEKVTLSPSGMLHLQIDLNKKRKINVLGGMYNYCITNTLFSLGRSLLSSDQDELEVIFPAHYTLIQDIGLNKDLNFRRGTLYDLYNSPDDFQRVFRAQKDYIERLLEYEIEVLLENQKPQTNKQILRIFIKLS